MYRTVGIVHVQQLDLDQKSMLKEWRGVIYLSDWIENPKKYNITV